MTVTQSKNEPMKFFMRQIYHNRFSVNRRGKQKTFVLFCPSPNGRKRYNQGMQEPKRKYILSDKKERGIIRIVDIQNDKTLLVKSEDIAKDIVDIRFRLDLESYPVKELQESYTAIGLELFSIEPMAIAKDGESLDDLLASSKKNLKDSGISFYQA